MNRTQVVEQIVEEALGLIEKKYRHLPYHNVGHTKRVIKAALELANDLALSKPESELIHLIAAAHDVVQDYDSTLFEHHQKNERDSAAWLLTHMQKSRVFTAEEMEHAQRAILATTVKHRDELSQSAEVGDLLSELLCDADLASLGHTWENYFDQMKAYYEEITPQPTAEKWRHYLSLQVPLLREHHYYTSAAQKRFSHLRENAKKIEELLGP